MALVALAAAIVAVVLVVAGGGGDDYEVTAEFTNASQLVRGNEVTIGGTRAGTVKSIELADNGNALVRFSVDEQFTPLPAGTIAQVRSFSLSGVANRQVQLTLPADDSGGEPIEDGGTLDRSQTISAVDLDQVFNTLDPDTVADFKRVVKGFSITVKGDAGKQANEGFRYLTRSCRPRAAPSPS